MNFPSQVIAKEPSLAPPGTTWVDLNESSPETQKATLKIVHTSNTQHFEDGTHAKTKLVPKLNSQTTTLQ